MSSENERLAMVRAAMPAVTAVAYLNAGSYGPLSRPAHEAIVERERRDLERGRAAAAAFGQPAALGAEARRAIGAVVGAPADEIAITRGTSDGMNYALWGIDWRPGDEIVTTNVEHIGGLAAAYVLRDRFGVRVRFADCADPQRAVAAVRAELSPRTRAVAYSHVAWRAGQVLPVAEIASLARAHGALAIVDGAQSAGAVPVDVKALGVDAYAVPGQKWLCGPGGTGGLYVSPNALDRMHASFAAYNTFESFDEAGHGELRPKAGRFELGHGHMPTLAGLGAALRWLVDDVGLDWAQARTVELADYARERLATVDGAEVGTPVGAASGLTGFALDGRQPGAVVEELYARDIVIRPVPGRYGLRVSTGFFNDHDDIDRLVEALGRIGA